MASGIDSHAATQRELDRRIGEATQKLILAKDRGSELAKLRMLLGEFQSMSEAEQSCLRGEVSVPSHQVSTEVWIWAEGERVVRSPGLCSFVFPWTLFILATMTGKAHAIASATGLERRWRRRMWGRREATTRWSRCLETR